MAFTLQNERWISESKVVPGDPPHSIQRLILPQIEVGARQPETANRRTKWCNGRTKRPPTRAMAPQTLARAECGSQMRALKARPSLCHEAGSGSVLPSGRLPDRNHKRRCLREGRLGLLGRRAMPREAKDSRPGGGFSPWGLTCLSL